MNQTNRKRTVAGACLAAILLLSGCQDATDDETGARDGPSPHGGIMDVVFPFNESWRSEDRDASYIAAIIHMENETRWRLHHRIETFTENATVVWTYDFLIGMHEGQAVKDGNGGVGSFPVCRADHPGSIGVICEPEAKEEKVGSGAFLESRGPGTYAYFAVVYGGFDTRFLAIDIGSNHSVELSDVHVGRSELILLDDGNEDVLFKGNETYVDATLVYEAPGTILVQFRGIRAFFDEFLAIHESGLTFHYERVRGFEPIPGQGDGRWFLNGEEITTHIFGGPAGEWVFEVRGDRSPDRPSSPVIGIVHKPVFLDQEGRIVPPGDRYPRDREGQPPP